eukprot:TRINITY_DN1987_c0_g1_i1.p1 TRINITY_DN1987_c0_g1~~TRINITY_DN1987_c0_g1_i1.p1  ORF type:complete len:93 (+),score=10.67 TRINITY_DN1987_c0_g1_i1:82-360(+)
MELRIIASSNQIMAAAALREPSQLAEQQNTYTHHRMIEVLCVADTPGGAEALTTCYNYWKGNYPDLRTHWCKSVEIDSADPDFCATNSEWIA